MLAGSFALLLVATPLCRAAALRFGIVDRPDAHLKPHGKPVPYLGGVAIFLGWAGGVMPAVALFGADTASRGPTLDVTMTIGVLLAGGAATVMGLFDDLRVMSPKAKLIGLTGVAILLMAFGLGNDTHLLFFKRPTCTPTFHPGWRSRIHCRRLC